MFKILLKSETINKIITRFFIDMLKEKIGGKDINIDQLQIQELDTGDIKISVKGDMTVSADFLSKLLSEGVK